MRIPRNANCWESCPDGILRFQLLRENGVALGRRKQLLQGDQAAAQVTAGKLSWTGIDVDVAADPVKVQSERIDERLPRIFAKRFAAACAARARAAADGLFQSPARLIDLAVNVRSQFLAKHARVGCIHFFRPAFAHKGRKQAIEAIVILGDFLIFQRENEHGFVAEAEMRGCGGATLGRLFNGDEVARRAFGAAALPPIRSFQIRNQQNRNLRQTARDRRRQGCHRLLQVFLQILLRHRNGRAEVGKCVAERNHFAAKAFGELAYAQFGQVGWGRHQKAAFILAPQARSRAQSWRSAMAGSTRDALSAGAAQARIATAASRIGAAANVSGSSGLTPNSSDPMVRVSSADPANPTAAPARTILPPPARTSVITFQVRAPNAMRTPNSRVRWLTENARTPNIPTAASETAIEANAATSAALNRGCATESEATCSMVRIRPTGKSLSTLATAALTALVRPVGSISDRTISVAPHHGFCVIGT